MKSTRIFRPLLRLTLFLLLTNAPALAQSEEGWTLVELLHAAREASPTAALASARVEAAQAGEDRARAGLWPSLTVSGSYVQTDEPMSAFGAILNQGTFDNTIDFNNPGTIDAFNARLEAHYRLYTGGRQRAGEALATATREEAEANRDRALLELENAVTRAYFTAREAEASRRALTAAIAALEESARVARLREEAGELHATERLNLEVTVAERASQILATIEQLQMSKRRLAVLLGKSASELVSLAEVDPGLDELTASSAVAPVHPSVRAAAAGEAQADAQLKMARGGRHPSVEAFARYQFDRGWKRDGEGDSWLAGVGVSFPLFDGFESTSAIREATAQRRAAEKARRLAELSITLAQAEAISAHERAVQDLALAETRFSAAQSSAEMSRARFAAQSLDSTALLAAEARLTDAQMALQRARLNERATLARVLLARGESLLNFF